MAGENEMQVPQPTPLRTGEEIVWDDSETLLANIKTNLANYLQVYAENRFTLSKHVVIAQLMLSKIEELERLAEDDVKYVGKFDDLVGYVDAVKVKRHGTFHNSFLFALLEKAKPALVDKATKLENDAFLEKSTIDGVRMENRFLRGMTDEQKSQLAEQRMQMDSLRADNIAIKDAQKQLMATVAEADPDKVTIAKLTAENQALKQRAERWEKAFKRLYDMFNTVLKLVGLTPLIGGSLGDTLKEANGKLLEVQEKMQGHEAANSKGWKLFG